MSEKDKENSKNLKIVYLGRDDGYFSELKKRYIKRLPEHHIDFKNVWMDDSKTYQEAFREVVFFKPDIIYSDFSKDTHLKDKLVNLLHRENTTKAIPLIGIVAEKEKLLESKNTGVMATFIKSGEYHDTVFLPLMIKDKDCLPAPSFAQAVFVKDDYIHDGFRIGYITPTYIHVEGNFEFELEETIEMDIKFPHKILKSNKFKVISKSTTNLYYDKIFAYDLECQFIDPPTITQELSKEIKELIKKILITQKADEMKKDLLNNEDNKALSAEELDGMIDLSSIEISTESQDEMYEKKCEEIISRKQVEYEEQIKRTKSDFEKWIKDNTYFSNAKKTKILINDSDLTLFKSSEMRPLDEYPYTFRVQTDLTLNLDQINTFKPQIITLQYSSGKKKKKLIKNAKEDKAENETAETAENPEAPKSKDEEPQLSNNEIFLDTLGQIITKIKEVPDYEPYIFLFNYNPTENLIAKFDWKNLLVTGQEFEIELMLKLAKMLEEKSGATLLADKDADQTIKYFIKKNNELSHGIVSLPIKIFKMSESECEVCLEKRLPDFESFDLSFPCPIGVTFIPHITAEKTENGFLHRGLLHSYTEDEKRDVRKFVNEIFFAELEEKKAQEKKEFEEMQKAAKQEEEEKDKKSQDASEDSDDKNDAKESKEEPKEESKEEPKQESKEESKEEPKQESKEEETKDDVNKNAS